MKRLIFLSLVLASIPAFAQRTTRVKGYTTKKGTYVAPHSRTSSDGSRYDNWSSKGNANPFTGKRGTKDPTPRLPKLPRLPKAPKAPKGY